MKLNTHVVCWDRMLQVHVFGPGDDVPEWAVKQITNPNVWEADEPDAARASDAAVTLAIPPKKGPKATAEVWREYAIATVAGAGLNIEIPADAGRGDIIEALTEAGLPTE